jgi:hypothetical protein
MADAVSGGLAAGGAVVGAVGLAGRTSIVADGQRVSLSLEGIGKVLREKDGAKKLNEAMAAALGSTGK